MKIAFLLNHLKFANGVSRSVIQIANLLSREGHHVTVYPLFSFEKGISAQLECNVKVKNIFGFYFRGMERLVDFIPYKFLYRNIVRDEYDVEVAFQYGLSTKIIAYSDNCSAKHICWMHGYDEGLILKKYYLKMDEIYTVSKDSAIRLKRELKGVNKIDYCYNLIDSDKIIQLSKEDSGVGHFDGKTFISVGRLSPEKGYDRLLKCIYKLKNEGYNFRLILVGDGPQKSHLENMVQKLELKNTVIFVGESKNPHKYTKDADCYICSSYHEGFSIASVEAVILGIPVITTNVGGARELIQESQSGMVVTQSDEGLLKGIRYVLDNPEINQQWKNTLLNTKNKFLYKNRVNQVLKIFS